MADECGRLVLRFEPALRSSSARNPFVFSISLCFLILRPVDSNEWMVGSRPHDGALKVSISLFAEFTVRGEQRAAPVARSGGGRGGRAQLRRRELRQSRADLVRQQPAVDADQPGAAHGEALRPLALDLRLRPRGAAPSWSIASPIHQQQQQQQPQPQREEAAETRHLLSGEQRQQFQQQHEEDPPRSRATVYHASAI